MLRSHKKILLTECSSGTITNSTAAQENGDEVVGVRAFSLGANDSPFVTFSLLEAKSCEALLVALRRGELLSLSSSTSLPQL